MKLKLTAKVLLFSMIIALFASTGCSKKDDEPSKTDLLTKEWNLISIDGENLADLEDETGFQNLLLKFETNGNLTLSITEEGTAISVTYKWSWGTTEETLNVIYDEEPVVWKIDKLTTDVFWFYDEDDSLFKLESNK